MRPEAPAVESPTVRPRRPGSRPRPDRNARRRRIALEGLEPRTLMAVLPAPTVLNRSIASVGTGENVSNESAPTIAVDPTNPNNLVAVYTRNDPNSPRNINNQSTVFVQGAVSTNGGLSWSSFSLPAPLRDPAQDQTTGAGARYFAQETDPSVAFDRNGTFYVVTSQHNAGNTSGAIVLNKFSFNGVTPGLLIGSNTVYQWGQDQALQPIVAVDNNLTSFTDPTTGAVQSDRFATNAPGTAGSSTAGNVYVAWSTIDSNPTGINNFNPNVIKLVVSSDGGNGFSTIRTISDGGNQTGGNGARNTTPRLAISQGSAGVAGGQVTIVWDDFNSLRNNTPVPRDAITVDRTAGGAGREVVYAGPTGIADAASATVPGVSLFPIDVTFPDATKFTGVTDLDVTVALTHPALQELQIRLIPPPGTGLNPITLLRNRNDPAGAAVNPANPASIGLTGADLGIPLGTGIAAGIVGTIFDADADRSIVNAGAGNATTGFFRPELGGLAAVYNSGLTPAQLAGTWTLEVTDVRVTGGSPPPTMQLREFALNFTSGLTTGNDVVLPTGSTNASATTRLQGGAVPTGTGAYPNAGAQAVMPGRGYGPAPVIAADNTLGSFSPFQGRLYVAYAGQPSDTRADNSNIYLMTSDNGGASWSGPVQVNDDIPQRDGFTQGDRPQLEPNVAVDPTTGTVVLSFLDARHDAARARGATTLAASIDGGTTFSPQTDAFLNDPQTVFDNVTRQTLTLGPIPENQSAGNPLRDATFQLGDRQGLAVLGGRVVAAWSGNQNGGNRALNRLDIRTAQASIAIGPRIVQSTMGPVTAVGTAAGTVNSTFAADGTQQVDGFTVGFDRFVYFDPALANPQGFGPADVTVQYRSPDGTTTRTIAATSVTPLDGVSVGGLILATSFLVRFPPQADAGTYSYRVGPGVGDLIRSVTPILSRAVFPSTNVPLRIPPGVGTTTGTTTSTLAVSGVAAGRLISDLNVNLTLTHTFDGDLVITLIAPDGTRIPLSNQNGGSGDNFTNTTFDDQAATSIAAGTAPFTGSFRPDGALLSAVNSTSPNGTWQLEIADIASGDSGFLLAWSLDFQLTGTAPAVTLGNLMDQDADGFAGEADQDAYAAPRPTGNVPFSGPFDPTTLPLIVPGPHAVAALTRTPDIYAPGLAPVNRPIPDVGTLDSPLVVGGFPAAGAITDVDVTVTIAHPAVGQLRLTLIAPGGAMIPLALNRGGGGANFINTTFDDSAPAAIAAGAAPFTGRFRPEGALGALIGTGPNGTWTLRIEDTAAGAAGTLVDWSLELRTAPGSTADEATLTQNTSVRAIDVTFDRAMRPETFTAADVLQVLGPAGPIPGPYTVTPNPRGDDPDPASPRTFRIGFAPQAIGGTYSVEIGPDIESRRDSDPARPGGDRVDTNQNAGLDALRGVGAQSATFTVPGPAALTLKPGQTVDATITLGAGFTIQDLDLALDITYPNDPDLTARLVALDPVPGGTDDVSILLFSGVGNAGGLANFSGTVFDDSAGTPIQNGVPPFSGRFAPQIGLGQNFGTLNGQSSARTYRLEITNAGTGTGTLNSWSLIFRRPVPGDDLGEAVSDRFSVAARVFTLAPGNPQASSSWTPVGPAPIGNSTGGGSGSGRIGGLAVDPSDPSGNTVFVAGASGGVWKTTDFLTRSPLGPTYVPLTDFGPALSLNIGGIAVFGRNNDPGQSIVFVATGEGDAGTPGVGFLRSLDGGRTWTVLDSTTNADAAGNIAPINAATRDHLFVGENAFKVVVDPRPRANGEVIVYAALSGPQGGIWRSLDTGRTWRNLLPGQATDLVLDPTSGIVDIVNNPTGNLLNLFAAIRGQGVFFSQNQGERFDPTPGGVGKPLVQDADVFTPTPIPVTPPPETPNGAKGRIVLAKPEATGDVLRDLFYRGWLYAAVATPDNRLDGLYMTKDFGQNWTKIRIPTLPAGTGAGGAPAPNATPTNDNSAGNPDYDFTGSVFPQANYDIAIVIDPSNPNIFYVGGKSDDPRTPALIRVDTTALADPHAFYLDNDNPDGGQLRGNTADPIALDNANNPPTPLFRPGFNTYDPVAFPVINLLRDPSNPLSTGSTFFVTNTARFTNTGADSRWIPFDELLADSDDIHRIVAVRDPLTGRTRLIVGDDHGVYTGLDRGDGELLQSIGGVEETSSAGGNTPVVNFSRNGNLQLTQHYYGASQPSELAAQITGALFYAQDQDTGFPRSAADVLQSGNVRWNAPGGGRGDGSGVATDQTGSGTVYEYRWPCCGGSFTNFFLVNGVPRTQGLVQQVNGQGVDPQWPLLSPSYTAAQVPTGNFAVNPFVRSRDPVTSQEIGQVIISSNVGRIFGTVNNGLQWLVIGEPTDLDSSYAPALAYGSPQSLPGGGTGSLNSFLYAGTVRGNVFVTFTGGGTPGSGQWVNLTAGAKAGDLAGNTAGVLQIIPSPFRDSREVYAVTNTGVYHLQDSNPASPAAWRRITGDLFAQMQVPFGGPGVTQTAPGTPGAGPVPLLQNTGFTNNTLTSLQVDWRYAIPDAVARAGDPSPTHPVLYVAGQGGVFRTLDDGGSWRPFPSSDPMLERAARDGGFLPLVRVSDLDLALGQVDPTTGLPGPTVNPANGQVLAVGPNVLLASTYGRGSFAIRVTPLVVPNTPQQPGLLALDPSTDTGFAPAGPTAGTDAVTSNTTPIVTGLTLQAASGNLTRISLFDVTDPANPVLIGGYDPANAAATDIAANRAGPDGRFRVQVARALPEGVRVLGVQATDLVGIVGNLALLTVVIDRTAPPALAAPDLQAATDSGQPRPPADADNVTNFNNSTPANAPVFDVVVPAFPPGEAVTAVQLYRIPVINGVLTLPAVLVNTRVNLPPGTVSIADINQPDPTLQTPGPAIPDGTYVYVAVLIDQAGNPGPAGPGLLVVIDTTAPTIATPDLTDPTDAGRPRPPRNTDDITNVPLPAFQGTVEAFALVQIFAQLAGQTPPAPAVLIGQGQADATGAYVVTATVPLTDGVYNITAQETDVAGNTGPMSGPLVVTIDLAPPPPISPDLEDPSDTGVSNTDNLTGIDQPSFVGTAEPGALVQIFAQLVTAPGQPTAAIILVGEAVADAAGAYRVTVGQYVQPAPTNPVLSLDDGSYNITALQTDVAGNPGRSQVFGNAGAVVIDGTDANDHGGTDFRTGLNTGGWFYMQQVLENIQPNVSNGNRVLLSLGADPSDLGSGFGAAPSIASAFAQSPLPALGWTIVFVAGSADIDVLLNGQSANARDQNNLPIVGGVRLAEAGILYITTSNNAFGDLTTQELAVVNNHGIDIANFVNAGGGLFAQAESPFSFQTVVRPFGWLQSIFPTINLGNPTTTGPNAIQITPAGMAAFPGLTINDLSTGPWHNFFGALPGPDGVVATVDDDFTPLAVAVTDTDFQGIRRNLILTSAGGVATTGLVVTIDTMLPAAPIGLDLLDASDSFFGVTDATGAHVVGSNADNYTNDNSPSFTVTGLEPGAAVALLRDGVLVAAQTAPAGAGPQTLTLTDPGPVADRLLPYQYQVQQRDPAGNLSGFSPTVSVRIDTSLPAVPSVPRLVPADDSGVKGDNQTNVPQPQLTGTEVLAGGEILPTIQLVDAGGTIIGEAIAGANGVYTVRLNVPIIPSSVNSFTVRARAVDQAGNLSAPSASYTLTIDTRVPARPTLRLSPLDDSGTPGDNVTNVRQPNLIGQTGPGGQLLVDLLLVGPNATTTLVTGVRTAADGTFQVRFPNTLADGTYQVQVRAYDAVGNQDFSDILTLTIDTTAPAAVPSLDLVPASDTGVKGDGRTSIRRPVLIGSVGAGIEPGTRVEIIDAAGNVLNVPASSTVQPDGRFTAQLANPLVNGTIGLRARLRDAAGNPGAAGPALVLTIFTTDGDYDADGRADLAVYQRTTAVPGGGQWSIARSSLGLQVASFGGSTDTPVQADFDGDGIDDLVVFRPETAVWFIGGSRGTARAVQFGPAGVSQPVAADFDGDGIADLAVYVPSTSPTASSTWFVLNSRDGTGRRVDFGGPTSAPVAADYDGDGRADIAAYVPSGSPTTASTWFVLGSRDGAGRRVEFGGGTSVPVPADYDGDGQADIAVYQPSGSSAVASIWFVLGSRDGGRRVDFGGPGHIPTPRDYDNDGRAEIATFEPGSAQWFILSSSTGLGAATPFRSAGDVPVPAPLPFRQAIRPATARTAAAQTADTSVSIRSLTVDPAPAAAVQAAPAQTPAAGPRSLDFGRTAARLASATATPRPRAQAAARRRRGPAQGGDRPQTTLASRRRDREDRRADAVADALERMGRLRSDRLVDRIRG
jgi:subtilisin-like proprotein convertase family protein